ncbi:MAG: DUF5103 domain-containing protein [Balneolaceae bacterium]|nr:DUF5103 domain-containing protein [Balneolaceae bacterium]MBO6547388.1 DUF5103 domain-containing protein [Balneolaceae bacterium]MBO6647665.1 DUF5103 domain-containing protein [Balneolaceae bacterium]
MLLVPGQLSTPRSIKSVQLYRESFEGNLPIIELGSTQKLILEFDELASVSGQYRISFSHHNKNWQESGLPDPWVFDGINELFVRGGTPNQQTKPDYFHYKTEFPNRNLNFTVSGHYLLHVFDYQSGTELFSLPFFVTEAEGNLIVRSETLFNQGKDGSALDQLFGKYFYPEFIEFPRFDLSYSFVQNRFWRQAKNAAQISFTDDGETEFHLSRNNSFPANFDFSVLDLSQLTLQNPQIFNFEPARTPQRVTLKDDFLNFLADPRPNSISELGFPKKVPVASYNEVIFRLNTGNQLNQKESVFLIGDFNQWTISERNELQFNPEMGVYQTSSLIKEGIYSYKYVTLENGEINDLRLSDSLTKRDQEYIGFVYYRDPQNQYDRLLNTKQVNARY